MGDSNPTEGERQLLTTNLWFKLFIVVGHNCDVGIAFVGSAFLAE